MMAKRMILALAMAAVCGWPAHAFAERFEQFGDLQVHYNALSTALLEPEVARHYGIVRSRNQGLLTVSLLRDGRTVPGAVQATATTLEGSLREVRMRQLREGDAVYYIGTFPVADQDLMSLQITGSAGGGETFTVRFRQRFFTEF